jgi:hypothetical protein
MACVQVAGEFDVQRSELSGGRLGSLWEECVHLLRSHKPVMSM